MALEYRVSFGNATLATVLVITLGIGEARGSRAYGGEDFKDAALDGGYIVEVLDDGEVTDGIVSESSGVGAPPFVRRV